VLFNLLRLLSDSAKSSAQMGDVAAAGISRASLHIASSRPCNCAFLDLAKTFE